MFVNPTELNTLSITALMLIPLIGVLIIALQGKSENTKAPHFIAAATTFTVFVLSLVMALPTGPMPVVKTSTCSAIPGTGSLS